MSCMVFFLWRLSSHQWPVHKGACDVYSRLSFWLPAPKVINQPSGTYVWLVILLCHSDLKDSQDEDLPCYYSWYCYEWYHTLQCIFACANYLPDWGSLKSLSKQYLFPQNLVKWIPGLMNLLSANKFISILSDWLSGMWMEIPSLISDGWVRFEWGEALT